MIEYGEFFNEETIEECTIKELQAIIKGLVLRLDQDQMLHNESLIDKRWFRETLKKVTQRLENYIKLHSSLMDMVKKHTDYLKD